MIRRQPAARLALAVAAMMTMTMTSACRQSAPPPPPPAPPAPRSVALHRSAARREVPFTHPLLAGATTAVAHEDCSPPALSAVVERSLAIEARSVPAGAGARPRAKPGASQGCPSPAAGEAGKMVRGELLARVASCVGQDGPLDAQWDMVHSAVLSLGVCLDCGRARDEQTAQCRRAHDVLQRAGKTPP